MTWQENWRETRLRSISGQRENGLIMLPFFFVVMNWQRRAILLRSTALKTIITFQEVYNSYSVVAFFLNLNCVIRETVLTTIQGTCTEFPSPGCLRRHRTSSRESKRSRQNSQTAFNHSAPRIPFPIKNRLKKAVFSFPSPSLIRYNMSIFGTEQRCHLRYFTVSGGLRACLR